MNDGKRFEDKVIIEDILKEPSKIVIAKIYLQTLKTNGMVTQNSEDIVVLQDDMKDKIGWKLFKKIAIFLTVIISILTVPSVIINIINLVVGK